MIDFIKIRIFAAKVNYFPCRASELFVRFDGDNKIIKRTRQQMEQVDIYSYSLK